MTTTYPPKFLLTISAEKPANMPVDIMAYANGEAGWPQDVRDFTLTRNRKDGQPLDMYGTGEVLKLSAAITFEELVRVLNALGIPWRAAQPAEVAAEVER